MLENDVDHYLKFDFNRLNDCTILCYTKKIKLYNKTKERMCSLFLFHE